MTTAGYGPTGAGQGPGDGSGGGWPDPARAAEVRDAEARPGPLPPRIVPPRGAAAPYPPAIPGQAPVQPPAPGQALAPGQAATPGQAAWSPPPNAGQWGGGAAPAAGQYPPVHGQQPAPSGVPAGPPPGPGPAYPPQGAPVPHPGPAWPAPAPAAAPTPRARGRALTLVALGLAVVLAVVAGVQAYQLNRLSGRLADTDGRLAAAQQGDGTRLDDLDQRTQVLEKQAGAQFNPEAVASAVLPSVFRVRAGQFTGTAFAVGKPASGGGTNLFTNFHVVESVWQGGGREVFLERTDQRYPATIVRVDEANDIAQLRTTSKFTGLVTASTAVKSGQQIVVVGAPLGLQDSVTTGVVSAFREAGQGSGPVIQFDAPINPGNSGGPVINGQKQVVGIATAKARDAEGIGLAVPIKVACDGFQIC
ncbi:S1C family serine protease [Micromonospora sp. NBC_01655]|uniref:S1C family serine protease n=1 Tax=Micromonospora sp. NBC_01655 TaxID=2975983 RepID=UPI0022576268|nr:S1C family serine protease [Micromonospora sp. NBC_01655]MCX4473704.1 S1C family serine protease [Micromonospora sp. NBC_01655]